MINLQEEDGMKIFPNNWELIISKSHIPFWTSDDPLVQQLVTTNQRFKDPYVKNYFPITPKFLMHSEHLSSRFFRPFKTDVSDIDKITILNRLTYKNAYGFVISNSEDIF